MGAALRARRGVAGARMSLRAEGHLRRAALPCLLLALLAGAAYFSRSGEAARSLQGASTQPQERRVDGDLRVDAGGQLVVDIGLRDYFDYHLSSADRIGLERAAELLLRDAGQRLGQPALDQLGYLLADYLDYRRARQALQERPLGDALQHDLQLQRDLLRQQNAQLASLRRQYLDADTVQAFFGEEEAYARFVLASLDLHLGELPARERQLALEALQASLPEPVRETGRRHGQALDVQAQTERLLRAGVSEQGMRAFLALHYDPQSVQRLLTEQRHERQWRRQYRAYRRQLDELGQAGLSAEAYREHAQQLQRRLFSGADLERAQHYDAFANNKNEASR